MAFSKEQQKLMDSLLKLDGAVVTDQRDVYSEGIETPSPSFNFIFGNTWLFPHGYTVLLGGEPKSGKSLIASAMVGALHTEDPDAVVLKFDTEFRHRAQLTPSQLRLWKIDPERLRVFETNKPEEIFDRIETIVPQMIQAGIKVRLVIIDSISDILGRRSQNADSVLQQQIGDKALTLQDGFGRIKSVLRKNNVSLILTTQIRAEMDPAEVQKGNKTKFAATFGIKHSAEYFVSVERLRTKAGKTDLLGTEFRDDGVRVDLTGQNKSEGDERAHKIRVKMVDSSLSRPGRVGVFTLDHDLGIINQHEEALLLGVGFGVVKVAGGGNYSFDTEAGLDELLLPYVDKSWRGKESILEAIRDNSDLFKGIIRTCKKIDIDRKDGILRSHSAPVESSPE